MTAQNKNFCRQWIGIAIRLLTVKIDEGVKQRSILRGEVFQRAVLIEGNLFLITPNLIDGVTIASPTASKDKLRQFSREAHEIGFNLFKNAIELLQNTIES